MIFTLGGLPGLEGDRFENEFFEFALGKLLGEVVYQRFSFVIGLAEVDSAFKLDR